MLSIADETKAFIETALDGDPALASLAIAGSSADTISAQITPGMPPSKIGHSTYNPRPPFEREDLVELVVRMERARWARFDEFTLSLPVPDYDDLHTLRDTYPRAAIGFEHGAGWLYLHEALFGWLHEIAADREWSPSQIKEKFGDLRFYWHGDLPDLGGQIIDAAEHISSFICEICGAPARIERSSGWYRCRCEEHADE